MAVLRQWVLVFCCGCILYGTMENLLPRRGVYPVIKMVFTLYIVLILLSPAGAAAALRTTGASQTPASSVTVPQADVLAGAAKTLQETLQDALRQAGLTVQLRRVQLEGSAETVTGVRLLFSDATPQERQAAQILCDSLLEMEAAYEWENG